MGIVRNEYIVYAFQRCGKKWSECAQDTFVKTFSFQISIFCRTENSYTVRANHSQIRKIRCGVFQLQSKAVLNKIKCVELVPLVTNKLAQYETQISDSFLGFQ